MCSGESVRPREEVRRVGRESLRLIRSQATSSRALGRAGRALNCRQNPRPRTCLIKNVNGRDPARHLSLAMSTIAATVSHLWPTAGRRRDVRQPWEDRPLGPGSAPAPSLSHNNRRHRFLPGRGSRLAVALTPAAAACCPSRGRATTMTRRSSRSLVNGLAQSALCISISNWPIIGRPAPVTATSGAVAGSGHDKGKQI